jgi:preprotein translocase subunit SecE
MAAVKDKEPRERESRDKEPQRENAIVRTYREIRSEMKKVVWPTREETARLTAVVIAVSVVASLILGASDLIFTFLLTELQRLVAR